MNKAQMLVIIQFILFVMIGGSFILLPATTPLLLRGVGASLVIFGLGIGLMAIREHKVVNQGSPNAVPTPQDSAQLVTSGLYSRIRHPIYTGVLLVGFGIGLVHGQVITLLAALALFALLTYKSMYEEELLQGHYPEYADYMRRTGRFIPRF